MKVRGLAGVKLVTSDGHKGIQAAVRGHFGELLGRYRLTEVSESLDKVETCVTFTSCPPCSRTYPRKIKKEFAYMLKDALDDERKVQELADVLDDKGYKSQQTQSIASGLPLNYKSFPRQHWRRIRTTNGLERINKG